MDRGVVGPARRREAPSTGIAHSSQCGGRRSLIKDRGRVTRVGARQFTFFQDSVSRFPKRGKGRKAARVGEIRPPAPLCNRASHWRQTARARTDSLSLSVRHQHQHRPLPASSQRRGRDDASDAANCLRSDGNSSEAAKYGINATQTTNNNNGQYQ